MTKNMRHRLWSEFSFPPGNMIKDNPTQTKWTFLIARYMYLYMKIILILSLCLAATERSRNSFQY